MTALLTPYDKGNAKPAGRNLWRKQLLPIAKIDYKGRTLDFTREYLAGLVAAFNGRAYDQVPFQLAPHGNEHTNDPERWRGEIAALELTDDGLDVIVAATDAGAQVLRDNPNLGVSARIVEDYHRADGQFWPRALQHVLGTLDPRITGMRPWQAVEAANDHADGDVIDLTDAEYTTPTPKPAVPAAEPAPPTTAPTSTGTAPTEDTHMAFTADQEARLVRLLDLPDDQFDALLTDTASDDDPQLSDEELAALLATLEDDTATADAAAGDGDAAEPGTETGTERQPVTAGAGASLSAEAQAAIDLANSRAEETSLELARVTGALNKAAYEKERDHYATAYGIPPRITDLARPVLEGENHVVELSNGAVVDAGAIVRKILTEVGKTAKLLDLTAELGTPLDGGPDTAAAEAAVAAERAEIVKGVRQMAGI